MRIYTRTGDTGETGLIGGQRVPKDDPRVEAYGTVDELNAVLGVARCYLADLPDLDALLERFQSELFDIGAELASPPNAPRSFKASRSGTLRRSRRRLTASRRSCRRYASSFCLEARLLGLPALGAYRMSPCRATGGAPEPQQHGQRRNH